MKRQSVWARKDKMNHSFYSKNSSVTRSGKIDPYAEPSSRTFSQDLLAILFDRVTPHGEW